MQNKGIAVGAYTISKHILDILYSEPNPAKAKAKAIQFIKQNNELRKKDGNSTEKTSKIIKFKKDVDNIESSD